MTQIALTPFATVRMRSIRTVAFFVFSLLPFAIQAQPATVPVSIAGQPDCRRVPAFTTKTGIDTRRGAFSTSDMPKVGLVYKEIRLANDPPAEPSAKPKIYQHPSWMKYGHMGPMVIDQDGFIYLAPIPFVNTLKNPSKKQNVIYRIDPNTGLMTSYLTLPMTSEPGPQNPYGVLGMGYDCNTKMLYVSSVYGSDRKNVRGRIYAIKTGTAPQIVDEIKEIDAFGMGIFLLNGKRKLLYGEARSTELYMVELKEDGRFAGKPEWMLSLDGIGIRGDDRARKVRVAENGDLTVSGIEFYFNLIAPTERQETPYTFRYDAQQSKWVLIRIGG